MGHVDGILVPRKSDFSELQPDPFHLPNTNPRCQVKFTRAIVLRNIASEDPALVARANNVEGGKFGVMGRSLVPGAEVAGPIVSTARGRGVGESWATPTTIPLKLQLNQPTPQELQLQALQVQFLRLPMCAMTLSSSRDFKSSARESEFLTATPVHSSSTVFPQILFQTAFNAN